MPAPSRSPVSVPASSRDPSPRRWSRRWRLPALLALAGGFGVVHALVGVRAAGSFTTSGAVLFVGSEAVALLLVVLLVARGGRFSDPAGRPAPRSGGGEEFAERIIEGSFDGILAFDAGGRYTLWNSGMERISGLPRERVLGRVGAEVFPFLETTGAGAYMAEALDGRTARHYEAEYEVPESDRSGYYDAVYAPLRDDAGRVVGGLGIVRDVTDRRELRRKLKESRDRLRRLSHRLIQVQEEERGRIARELHDQIGQALTAVRLELEGTRGAPADDDSVDLAGALDLIDDTLDQVRDLSFDLRPAMLDELGLEAALRTYVGKQASAAELTARVEVEALDWPLPEDVETTLFRITQEAMTNVLRHADAAEVTVGVSGDRHGVVLRIRDDGVGMRPPPRDAGGQEGWERRGSGILGMRERAGLVGGSLVTTSTPDEGTEIRVRVPLFRDGSGWRAPGPDG